MRHVLVSSAIAAHQHFSQMETQKLLISEGFDLQRCIQRKPQSPLTAVKTHFQKIRNTKNAFPSSPLRVRFPGLVKRKRILLTFSEGVMLL